MFSGTVWLAATPRTQMQTQSSVSQGKDSPSLSSHARLHIKCKWITEWLYKQSIDMANRYEINVSLLWQSRALPTLALVLKTGFISSLVIFSLLSHVLHVGTLLLTILFLSRSHPLGIPFCFKNTKLCRETHTLLWSRAITNGGCFLLPLGCSLVHSHAFHFSQSC